MSDTATPHEQQVRPLSVYDKIRIQLRDTTPPGIPPTFRLWHPPLVNPTALDKLLKAAGTHQHLRVPVAIIDVPFKHSQHVWFFDLSANAAIGGKKQSGKSTFLQTLIMAGAATHSPRDLQFYCLDFSSNLLIHIEDLPHVGSVATSDEVGRVRRTIAEFESLLETRRALFKQHRIVSISQYRTLRNDPNHPVADDPFGDAVLIIDGWSTIKNTEEFEPLVERINMIAENGPAFGVHVVISTSRWTDVRSTTRDHLGARLEFQPADIADLGLDKDRKAVGSIPPIPGRAMGPESLHMMIAAPRLDGEDTIAGIENTFVQSCAKIADHWKKQGFDNAPQVRSLPELIHIDTIRDQYQPSPTSTDDYTTRWTIPIGISEASMAPATANLADYSHLLVFGSAKSGRSATLRAIIRAITAQNSPQQVRFIVIDYRSRLLGAVPDEYLLPGFYIRNAAELERAQQARTLGPDASDAERIRAVNPDELLASKLATRLPPHDITPAQMRSRSWWEGAELVLLIDDWELVAQSHTQGLGAMRSLMQYIPQARDVGFHIIASARMEEAQAILARPGIIKSTSDLKAPTILLSGDKTDYPSGREFAVTRRPPGQAWYKTPDAPLDVIQAGYMPPPD